MAVTAFLLFDRFSGDVALCYFVVVCAALGAGACLSAFALHDFRLGYVVWTLIGHAAALIFVFAGVFRGAGLLLERKTIQITWEIALYFSIVTWTTLGYGDYTPPLGLELIAAFEAILGYVFFGMIVSLGVALIRR